MAHMYKIEKKDNNIYKLTFKGFIDANEMKLWVEESKRALTMAPKEFGVFVDMRGLQPLSKDAQVYMQEGQRLYKKKGMIRSVVILGNALTTMQFRRIGKETGISQWERYINYSSTPDWEKLGMDWITKGIEIDLDEFS
jgi:hypothetical protein